MSKNYDLYPKYERKIDNLKRRILGYEKMKRDLQRHIQILKNKNKKQKEVIDKAIEYINENVYEDDNGCGYHWWEITDKDELLDILKRWNK